MSNSIYTKEYQEITKKLRKARVASGLKQIDVAIRLGKPQSYVSKIEKGERRLDILELNKIAKIYNKNISYFI